MVGKSGYHSQPVFEMLQWLDERGIKPFTRVKESPNPTKDLYGIEKFTYVPE